MRKFIARSLLQHAYLNALKKSEDKPPRRRLDEVLWLRRMTSRYSTGAVKRRRWRWLHARPHPEICYTACWVLLMSSRCSTGAFEGCRWRWLHASTHLVICRRKTAMPRRWLDETGRLCRCAWGSEPLIFTRVRRRASTHTSRLTKVEVSRMRRRASTHMRKREKKSPVRRSAARLAEAWCGTGWACRERRQWRREHAAAGANLPSPRLIVGVTNVGIWAPRLLPFKE